jgi:hypothetical protein
MFCSRSALQKEFFRVRSRMRERWSKLQANWDLYQPSGTELFRADEELKIAITYIPNRWTNGQV